MKKKEFDAKKDQHSKEVPHSDTNQEEVLDLDSLLDVQGGQNDKEENAGNCGLGCFSGAVYQKDQTSQDDDRKG